MSFEQRSLGKASVYSLIKLDESCFAIGIVGWKVNSKMFLGEMSIYVSIQEKKKDIWILWIINNNVLWTVSIWGIEKEMKWHGNCKASLSFILCRLLSWTCANNQLKFMSKKHLRLSKRAMIPPSKNKMSYCRWTSRSALSFWPLFENMKEKK